MGAGTRGGPWHLHSPLRRTEHPPKSSPRHKPKGRSEFCHGLLGQSPRAHRKSRAHARGVPRGCSALFCPSRSTWPMVGQIEPQPSHGEMPVGAPYSVRQFGQFS
jgi:hypothetical protein